MDDTLSYDCDYKNRPTGSHTQPLSTTTATSTPATTITTTSDLTSNMNPNNTEQSRSLSDDILCCDDDSQSDDFKLSTSSNLDQFTTSSTDSHSQVCSGGVQGRRGLVHSVSIIVEPAIMDECDFDSDLPISPQAPTERRKTIAGPIVLLEDFYFDQPKKAKEYDDIVQNLFASARIRKEEFARLLEEHAQIVKEINKAETDLL